MIVRSVTSAEVRFPGVLLAIVDSNYKQSLNNGAEWATWTRSTLFTTLTFTTLTSDEKKNNVIKNRKARGERFRASESATVTKTRVERAKSTLITRRKACISEAHFGQDLVRTLTQILVSHFHDFATQHNIFTVKTVDSC